MIPRGVREDLGVQVSKYKMDRRVQILLSQNEWLTFECKRAAVDPRRALETVCAFANSSGGTFVLGLEDPKKASGVDRVIGISENEDNVSEFLKLLPKEFDPPITDVQYRYRDIHNFRSKKDKLVLVQVAKSNQVHSLKKGDTFVRKGNQNTKIGATEIMRLQYEKGISSFEDEESHTATLEDLSREVFFRYKQDTNGRGDDWQFLKDNGLTSLNKDGEMMLTKSGVLLFGNNPAVLLKSKCSIKISHYFGREISYTGESNFVERPFSIEGPLISQIQQTVEYFRSCVKKSPPKLRGGVFRPSFLIPEWAFQEAVANAVIHRNYYVEDDIHIRIFDDRIEIESPGTYPGIVTPDNIRTERFARNPVIQRVLNRFQEAPNLDIGEGVDRMFTIMKEQNLYEPLYAPATERPNSVLLTLFNMQKVEYWDAVSKFLDENFQITNAEARSVTGIADTTKMSRLLSQWVKRGLLVEQGVSRRGRAYRKPGKVRISNLFSDDDENKREGKK